MRWISAALAVVLLIAATPNQKQKKSSSKAQEKKGSLEKVGFQEIIDRYLFISDFNQKPDTREISTEEVFWRYPFKISPQTFEFSFDKDEIDKMVFRVPGEGRMAEHFAKGRVEFLEGRYDDAQITWLTGRQQFDKDPLTNRRFEFFLAINAAQKLRLVWAEKKGDLKDATVKQFVNRLSYFLAAVYIMRRDVPDPEIDKHAAWGLYNLSVAYYMLERWSLVFGATEEGLSALLKQGKKEYRPKFRQMMAEMYLKNQDLLPAIQELDTAIRQDPDPDEAGRMFNRVGDVYYALNNFELAEDVYALAARVDETRMQYVPGQAVLRGESIFWLGQFAKARRMLQAALNTSIVRDRDWLIESGALPWLRLRIADTYLAELATAKGKQRESLLADMRLAYFRVESEHPSSEAAKIAAVRGACLELPAYQGNNIKHARELLETTIKNKDVPDLLMEMVEACYVGSFSERERTPDMVEKVKSFSDKYPKSKFLEKMIPAVREVQATNIEPYFEKKQNFMATDFFEKKRAVLYPVVPNELSHKLFNAYVDTNRSDKAKEFWAVAKTKVQNQEGLLRAATFLSDVSSQDKKKSKIYEDELKKVVKDLEKSSWSGKPTKLSQEFVSRMINGPRVKDHILWIAYATDVWAKDENDRFCSVDYPLSERVFSLRKDGLARSFVQKKLDTIFPENWPEILKENPSCAQSWLDLETKFSNVSSLPERYAKRNDWPLEGPWLERLWVYSEELEKSGQDAKAKDIWSRIARQAPAESFESKMAKTRLAPPATEVERLWR